MLDVPLTLMLPDTDSETPLNVVVTTPLTDIVPDTVGLTDPPDAWNVAITDDQFPVLHVAVPVWAVVADTTNVWKALPEFAESLRRVHPDSPAVTPLSVLI